LETNVLLKKVVSGGQTGADQAGLFAAARFGIVTGGWMPKEFKTLSGPNPELAARFGLREHRSSKDYPDRTELNCRVSDGTLWFGAKLDSNGERCTYGFLRRHGKPSLRIDTRNPRPVEEVVEWIRRQKVKTLNIAGNAEPKSRKALAHGVTDFVLSYLGEVFSALGHRRVE
jgi:hypothetical protein